MAEIETVSGEIVTENGMVVPETVEQPGAGRKAKIDRARVNRLVAAIKAGNYLDTSAQFAGVTISTYGRWMQKGKKAAERRDASGIAPEGNDALYCYCYEAVTEAIAEAEIKAVSKIRQAGEREWQAFAWWLERKFPDKWGRNRQTVTHEIELSGGVTIHAKLLDANRDTFRQLADASRERNVLRATVSANDPEQSVDSGSDAPWRDAEAGEIPAE